MWRPFRFALIVPQRATSNLNFFKGSVDLKQASSEYKVFWTNLMRAFNLQSTSERRLCQWHSIETHKRFFYIRPMSRFRMMENGKLTQTSKAIGALGPVLVYRRAIELRCRVCRRITERMHTCSSCYYFIFTFYHLSGQFRMWHNVCRWRIV